MTTIGSILPVIISYITQVIVIIIKVNNETERYKQEGNRSIYFSNMSRPLVALLFELYVDVIIITIIETYNDNNW